MVGAAEVELEAVTKATVAEGGVTGVAVGMVVVVQDTACGEVVVAAAVKVVVEVVEEARARVERVMVAVEEAC